MTRPKRQKPKDPQAAAKPRADRKGVLVRFPADVLADLDAEAERTGRARMEIIVERCTPFKGKRVSLAPDPEEARAFLATRREARPGESTGSPQGRGGVQFGPSVYTPGSRLKGAGKKQA